MSTKIKKRTPSGTITLWLAYLSTLLAWCWLVICYAKNIIESEFLAQFINTKQSNQVVDFNLPAFTIPQEIINIIGALLALAVITFVAIELIRAPRRTQNLVEPIAQHSSEILTPLIARYYHLDKNNKRTVHYSIVYVIRLAVSWAPLIIMDTVGQQVSFMPYEYMIFGVVLPAAMATVFFSWIGLFDHYLRSQEILSQN